MSPYLLDTSILSVFAPTRARPSPELIAWMDSQSRSGAWYLSAIVVVEIERGIAKLRRTGGTAKAEKLSDWLEHTLAEFDRRVLPIDQKIGQEAGRLEDHAIASGHDPGMADILIAATARVHGLTILTANVRHFAVLDVPLVNPLTEIPPNG